jgi:hypothetical protein
MRHYLTSFASADFATSLDELVRSASAYGIDEVRTWNPEKVRATPFYHAHRALLDRSRGAGYWLWKPYIIERALDEARDGDIVVYADAGVSVVRSLRPLFDLCHAHDGILLFAGHYEGLAAEPNICRISTKRDCFVLMDCDEHRYHEAPMLDASFLVLEKNSQSIDFVRRWREFCSRPEILSDAENVCGKENLPGFIEHRHDQSVLSLLAARDQLEVFRGPSQFGNHCKTEEFREPGEWTRRPYESRDMYPTSRYGTLLFHHRKRTLDAESGGATELLAMLDASLVRRRERPIRLLVSEAADEDAAARAEVRSHLGIAVEYVRCGALDADSCERLRDSRFDVIVSGSGPRGGSIASEFRRMLDYRLLEDGHFVVCWRGLEDMAGWLEFRTLLPMARSHFGARNVNSHFGWLRAGACGTPQTAGIIGRVTVDAC